MRREGALVVIGLAAFLGASWAVYTYEPTVMGFIFGVALGSVLLLVLLFFPRLSLGLVPADVRTVHGNLAFRIRLMQHHVKEAPMKMTVAVGSFTAFELHLRSTPQGTRVSYRAATTQVGLGVLIMPLWFLFPSIATLVTAPLIYIRSALFVRKHIAQVIPELGLAGEGPRLDDIGSLLVTSAAENHRLFSDAYRAARDRYIDHLGIVFMMAMFAWFVMFLFFGMTFPGDDYMRKAVDAIVPSTVGTVCMAIPLALIVRRRHVPRLRRWRRWVDRIAEVWRVEATGSTPGDSAPSSFEVLSEAAREIPGWADLRRKTALGRNWVAWTLLFIMSLWGIQMTLSGIVNLAMGLMTGQPGPLLVMGLAVTLAGVAVLAGAYVYYRYWKGSADRETDQELADWNLRHEELKSRMEKFLREL